MPSFRRRAATPLVSAPVVATAPSTPALVLATATQESAPILIVASPPQLFPLIDEDDEISPSDGDLSPRKRRAVDAGKSR